MIKETLTRLSAPMPAFFKRLRNLGASIGLSSTAAAAAIQVSPLPLPACLSTYAGYGIVVGVVTTFVCHLTVDDNKVKI